MAIRLIYISCLMLIITVSSCTPIDYQTLKVDNQNQELEIISSGEFVIDSVSIEKFGTLYFSKSLEDKTKGSKSISFKNVDMDYQTYIDSLSVLKCDDDNLSLDIIIRKKGSNIKITKEIAMNFKHLDEVQILRGLKYNPCSKEIDTMETDRRYK